MGTMWIALVACIGAAGLPARASAHAGLPDDQELARLANMSLEELMNAEVVSVAGTPRSRMETPAALTVITAEDVRRSGARSVAEALRLVPGMYVGRINSSSWVIGARGLTGTTLTATRHLVLIDGRLVYDPLISSTFWDTVDVPLADLDRIEVVRGPGATLWGVNAMNGVVNIITRKAADTQGTLVEAGAGSNGESGLTVRHGGTTGDGAAWRAWAKYEHHGDFEGPDGASLQDEWSNLHGGFRLDGRFTPEVRYTFQGDAYSHPEAMSSVRLPVPGAHQQFEQVAGDDDVSGANLLFRAISGLEGDRGWMFRAYYDHTRRDTPRYGARRDTVDMEYRRWLGWSPRNALIWGFQYDHTRDDVDNGPVLQFDPASRGWDTFNAFVQNTTELVPGRAWLMLGTKLTQHSFVGFQAQPSLRLWWTPSERQTLWMAVSRPVRVPSRFEEDGLLVFSYADTGILAGGPPSGDIVPIGLAGDDQLQAEHLVAWEAGHRWQAGDGWLVETSLFYNDYRRLIGVPPTIVGKFNDLGSGATWGGDISVSAQLARRWKLQGSYSRLKTRVDGPIYPFEEAGTPATLAQLHSWFDLGDAVQLGASVYHASEVPLTGIPAYTRADVGARWRAARGVEVSVWAQNILHAGHREASGALVPRGIYAQVAFGVGR
ncbi:MAG TPA: TonB-dependent receptor [Luteimonas sp.]|nr:TonB-dependent receptor [Luteimonas sp.]